MVNYNGNESDEQAVSVKPPAVFYGDVLKMMTGGSQKESIGALEMFLAIWPDFALAHNDLGVLYFEEGEKEKALEHYGQAERLEPENATFRKNLADFYYVEAGRVEEAMGLYVKVLDANPTDIEVLLILGTICVSLKKHKDAKFFYERVLEVEPWNADARERLDEQGMDDSLIGGLDDLGKDRGQRAEDGNQGKETNVSLIGGFDDSGKYLVSAIVSTYNSERFIRGCLEDLEAQTIADRVEIIVVNSGSEQNEEAIVKEFQLKYSNIKYIKTDQRETVYAAWNRGIKASTGKYITNANTDDRRFADAIEILVNVLEENPEIALAYGDFDVTDMENRTPKNANIIEKMVYPAYKRGTLLKSCYPGPMPVWRMSVHDEFGYFNESFVSAGDREFWCRISQKYPMLHVKKHMGVYYRNPEGIENRNKSIGIVQQEADRISKRYIKSFQLPWDDFRRIDFHVEDNFAEIESDLNRLETSGGGFHVHVEISSCKLGEYLWLRQKRNEGLVHELSLTQNGKRKFPSVAILMFTYDRLEYTREALHTLMKNTRYPFDLYIVDNYSTDGTREWLETARLEYPGRIKDIRYNSTNEGLPGPTNDFWSRVDVDLMGKVDNDTLVPSGWLERLVEAHQKVPKLAVVGGYHFRPEDFDEKAAQDKLYAENDIRILQDTHIGGCAYLMKKSIQQQFGLMKYNPALKIHGWTEYQHMLAGTGYIVGYLYPLIKLEYMDDPRSKKCLINEKYQDYTRNIWRERGINFKSTDQIVEWLHRDAQRITNQPSSEASSFKGENQQTNKSYYGYARPEIQALVSRKAKKILDIGCGAGVFGRELKNRQKCYVAGIEYAPEAANKAETVLDRVYTGDAVKIIPEIQKNSFDAIIMADFLEHIANPEKILSDVKRILMPAGKLVLSIPNVRHWSVIKDLLEGRWEYRDAGILDKTHLRFFTWQSILSLLNSAGYHIDSYSGTYLQGYDVPMEFINLSKQCGIDTSSLANEGRIYQYLITCTPQSGDELPEISIQKQTVSQNQFTSIIILTHNQLEYTRKCIESIFKYTKGPIELIVVDNGSTDGTVKYLESLIGGRKTEDGEQRAEVGKRTDGWMDGGLDGKGIVDSLIGGLDDSGKDGGQKSEIGDRKSEVRIKIIKNSENLGFAAGNNQGIAAARGDYILLMNNDIVVTPGWLERMILCAERDPKIGIVGPMSNCVTGPQLINEVTYNKTNLKGLNDFAAEISNKYAGKSKQFLHVVGFCMLIKRVVIDKIGGLDEIYGTGNLEDADFCLRATLAGFGSWRVEDCFIHHFGSRTFTGAKIDYSESLHKNWEIFKEKWDMPRDMPYGSYEIPNVLERGFIPEKHISPLPEKQTFTVYEAADLSEIAGGSRLKTLFKKKCNPDILSVIIPVAGHAKHLKKCIENVRKHTPEAHEIIFVDNGCNAGTLKWIRQAVKRKSNYRLIKAGKKASLAKCFNRGMEASTGEYIVLLFDNVIVADGWADGMLKCINSPDDVGIVGPMTDGKAAGIQCAADSDHLKIGQLKNFSGAFLERNRYRRVPSREIAGFCMLFCRSLVEQIGPFDEDLEQGSESDDYCLRAELEGYNNFIAGDVFVLCNDLRPQGNKRSFKHKWRSIDVKSHDGERRGVLSAITDAERLYQREEVDKAIVTLIDGIKYRPDEEATYHRLAEMLIDCERFKEGLEAINSIPEDKRGSAKTLELTGYCKAGLDLYDEAAQYADRALSLNASSAPALNLMGVLAHQNGNKQASEDFFKKAIASDPGYGEAYANLGAFEWEAERKDDALELLEKGFILSPTAEDGRTAYLSAISETAEFERAEGVFREAKTLYPESRRIAFLLIDILIRQEKYESAMQDIHEAMITFGINDAILSAAQSVIDRFDAQETKDIEKKPALSLCMIVKDEEDCLARCLLSAVPVVDEIIIVDTGSTDRTKAIAKTFGAKVYDFEWTDDFSEARNLSLSKATGDWLLVLDADEIISPLDYDRLTKIVKGNTDHPAAYLIITRNYVRPTYIIGWTCNDGQYAEEEIGTGWYPSPKVRLFSNDIRIRFENPVHEIVGPALKRHNIKINKCDIPVHHYGQLDTDHYDAKSEAYYLLGKKKLEEEGEDLKTLIELATQAQGKLGKYEEAVDLWKRVLKIDPGNKKALLNMGCTCFKLEEYEPARTSSKIVMELDPSLKEAVIIYTTCEVLIGDTEKTIPILENLLKKEPEYPLAIAVLAASYGMGDEKEKGLEHIKYLMKMGFLCEAYLYDLSQRLISVGKTDRAISLLKFAVESGNGTREIRELLDGLLIG